MIVYKLILEEEEIETLEAGLECLQAHLEHYDDESPNYSATLEDVASVSELLRNLKIDSA